MPFITIQRQPRILGMADGGDEDRGVYGFLELNLDRIVMLRPTGVQGHSLLVLDNGDEIYCELSHGEFVELVREAEARGT